MKHINVEGIILKHFSPDSNVSACQEAHRCDVCHAHCDCGECISLPGQIKPVSDDQEIVGAAGMAMREPSRSVSEEQKAMLSVALMRFRESKELNRSIVTAAILTGLDNSVIEVKTSRKDYHTFRMSMTSWTTCMPSTCPRKCWT